MCTSFYADDAALFLNPVKEELTVVASILNLFNAVSGLKINLDKCVAYPISCNALDVSNILSAFGGQRGSLPCKYLGLPLGYKKPRKIDCQPILDKITASLKPRKGKLMSREGRLVLVNSVLTAITTYFFTAFTPSKWLIKKIDKIRRSFLWCGEEDAHGGKCLVNWKKVCSPKSCGGLGVKNLEFFSRALRLRWIWYGQDDEDRPWKGMAVPCNEVDQQLFSACTSITIKNGEKTSFWKDNWLPVGTLHAFAPDLHKMAFKKNLTVKEGL